MDLLTMRKGILGVKGMMGMVFLDRKVMGVTMMVRRRKRVVGGTLFLNKLIKEEKGESVGKSWYFILSKDCIEGNVKFLVGIRKEVLVGKSKLSLVSKSKGKGYCGTIKRYNFKGNRRTHGNSKAHRKPGAIGMCQTPGRLLKGKRMAGCMGNRWNRIKGIMIVYFNGGMIMVNGSIPGSTGSSVWLNDE